MLSWKHNMVDTKKATDPSVDTDGSVAFITYRVESIKNIHPEECQLSLAAVIVHAAAICQFSHINTVG